MLTRWIGGALLALGLGCNVTAATLTVRLAENGHPDSPLIVYRKELIELALHAAGYTPQVRFCNLPGGSSSDRRIIREVSSGERCDVLATSSGGEASRELRLVPVPIYLGGGGLRVWMMNRASLERLPASPTSDDLHRMRLGSGYVWADTRIWELNGYTVEKGDYNALFDMLAAGRFDAFPRSVFEISGEYAGLDPAVYAIEPHLLFRMHMGIFFYVSPREKQLAQALALGMHRLYCSGDFEQFMRHQRSTRDAVRSLLGGSRRIVELTAPEPVAEEARALKDYVPSWIDPTVQPRVCSP